MFRGADDVYPIKSTHTALFHMAYLPMLVLVCEVVCPNIGQTLVNSLHGLLNCEIGGLECHVITTEYRTRAHCIHM